MPGSLVTALFLVAGGPMFDLLYLVLTVVLFGISIAMIRFFDRL